MGDVWSGLLLTDTVVAATRLAGSRRPASGRLDTQTLLLALDSADNSGAWSRFVISDLPGDEPDGNSDDSWDGIPLTQMCAEALRRARVIAEAYRLVPLPPGALALALVWDPKSAAARSFVGLAHPELIAAVQQALLGTDLEGLEDLLADRQPSDSPNGGTEPRVSEAEADRTLRPVIAFLPLWLLRLLALAALVGIAISLATSAAWAFRPRDDLAPPLPRPAIAAAIPDDTAVSKLLGTKLVRVLDGLPLGTKLFDSMLPAPYDIRTQVVDSAQAVQWISADSKTHVAVSLVRVRAQNPTIQFGTDCRPEPSGAVATVAPELRAGYVTRNAKSAQYCALAFDKQTQIYVAILSGDPTVLPAMAGDVQVLQGNIQRALPTPTFTPVTRTAVPYTRASLNRGFLVVAIGLPLLWALPTLLFDRATWQRLWWTVSLKRFRSLPLPGLDIDWAVRGRLWSATALACVQVLAVIWALRLTTYRGLPETAATVICAVVLTSAVPRLLYLSRAGRSQVFAGRKRVFWLFGTLVGVAAVIFAGLLVLVTNTVSAFGGGYHTADYIQQRFDLVIELLLIPASLIAVAPAMLLRSMAMRTLRAQPVDEARPPVLLLRSFADDGRRLRARSGHRRAIVDRLSLRRWERFEEVVAASLGKRRSVFAVGQLGERLPPPLGAVRRQFSNEEWQDKVQLLMADASLICVTLGRSANLDWEIRRIAQLGQLGKTIFVLPPTGRREHLKRLAVLAAALELEWADLNVTLSGSWALVIRVPAVGAQPQVIRARAQEDVGYDIGLELAMLVVAGLEFPVPSLAGELKLARPTAEVHAPGKAPVFKPILRRKAVWVALCLSSSSLVSLPFTFIAGESDNASSTIALRSGYSWWAAAADPAGTATYALVNGVALEQLNFKKKTAAPICKIDEADNLTAQGGWLFAWNEYTGTVQAIDPVAHRVLWTLGGQSGVRGLVPVGDTVYFLLPASKQVRAVDRRTGKPVRTVSLSGTPWSSASDGSNVYVSLIDSSEVVELATTSLSQIARFPTGADPSQLAVGAGSLWVYSAMQHSVTALTGGLHGAVIRTRSQDPHLGSNGGVLAIEGIEQISTVGSDGLLRRNRLSTRHADAVSVTGSGDVLIIADDQTQLIHPPKHR